MIARHLPVGVLLTLAISLALLVCVVAQPAPSHEVNGDWTDQVYSQCSVLSEARVNGNPCTAKGQTLNCIRGSGGFFAMCGDGAGVCSQPAANYQCMNCGEYGVQMDGIGFMNGDCTYSTGATTAASNYFGGTSFVAGYRGATAGLVGYSIPYPNVKENSDAREYAMSRINYATFYHRELTTIAVDRSVFNQTELASRNKDVGLIFGAAPTYENRLPQDPFAPRVGDSFGPSAFQDTSAFLTVKRHVPIGTTRATAPADLKDNLITSTVGFAPRDGALPPSSIDRRRQSMYDRLLGHGTTVAMAMVSGDAGVYGEELYDASQVNATGTNAFTRSSMAASSARVTAGGSKMRDMLMIGAQHNVFMAGADIGRLQQGTYGKDGAVSNVFVPVTVTNRGSDVDEISSKFGVDTGILSALNATRMLAALLRPVKVRIVRNIAKVVWWNSGGWTVHPMYQKATFPDAPSETEQDAAAFANLKTYIDRFGGSGFEVVGTIDPGQTKAQEAVVVHSPASVEIWVMGFNRLDRFAIGNLDSDQEMTGTIFKRVIGLTGGIKMMALGYSHSLYVSTNGLLYFGGEEKNNNQCSKSEVQNSGAKSFNADVFPTSSAPTAEGFYSTGVLYVAAGYYWSAFAYQRSDFTHQGHLCGGTGFMMGTSSSGGLALVNLRGVPYNPNDRQEIVTDPVAKPISITAMVSGHYHMCFAWTSDTKPYNSLVCVGRGGMSANPTGVAPPDPPLANTDPTQNGVICQATRDPPDLVDAKDMPVVKIERVKWVVSGSHHLLMSMAQFDCIRPADGQPLNPGTSSFPTFSLLFSCGDSTDGAIATGDYSPANTKLGNRYVTFAVPQGVISSRAPNVFLRKDLQAPPPNFQPGDEYQLQEVLGVDATGTTSFVFTTMKQFNTPAHLIANYTSVLRQRPPNGAYTLDRIFADGLVSSTHRYGARDMPLPRNENLELVWNVSFTVIPGLAAFHLGTQPQLVPLPNNTAPELVTASDELYDPLGVHFPTGNETDIDENTTWPKTDTFPEKCVEDNCFRDWKILRENHTNVVLNLGSPLRNFTFMIKIPHVFFKIVETDTIIPMREVSTNCTPNIKMGLAYCHEATKTVLLMHQNYAQHDWAADGYTVAANMSAVEFYVSIGMFNFTKDNKAYNYLDFVTQDEINTALAEAGHMPERFDCVAHLSAYDCSSTVFVEGFSSTPGHQSPSYLTMRGHNHFHYVHAVETASAAGRGAVEIYHNHSTTNVDWRRQLMGYCLRARIKEDMWWIRLLAHGEVQNCASGARFARQWLIQDRFLMIQEFDSLDPNKGTPVPHRSSFAVFFELNTGPFAASYVFLLTSPPNAGIEDMTTFLIQQPTLAKDYNSYLVLRNDTLRQMEASSKYTSIDTFAVDPVIGTYAGGVVMPVLPHVKRWDVFEVDVKPIDMTANDAIVIELLANSGDRQVNKYDTWEPVRFLILEDRINAIKETFPEDPAQIPPMVATIVDENDGGNPYEHSIANPTQFVCKRALIKPSMWNRFMVAYDNATGATSVYLDSQLVCRGALLTETDLQDVTAIRFGFHRPRGQPTAKFQLRDLGMCNKLNSTFPCRAGDRVIGETVASETVTQSLAITTSQSVSGTESASVTSSSSVSESTSVSESHSLTISHSVTESDSVSISTSLVITGSSSQAITGSMTETGETVSKSLNISFRVGDMNFDALTAHNIRRNGVIMPLILNDAAFRVAYDDVRVLRFAPKYPNKAVLFWVNSTLTEIQNPNGFAQAFYRDGFMDAQLIEEDASRLAVSFGPFRMYNAFADETVIFRTHELAVSSNVSFGLFVKFKIKGRGFLVDTRLRNMEATAAVMTFIAAGLGAMPSNAIRMSLHSMMLNFHCFNNEAPPQMSLLWHPTQLSLRGRPKLGVMAATPAIVGGIFLCFFAAAAFVRHRRHCSWKKAHAYVYFPSAPMVVSFMFIPSYIAVSFQAAWELKSIAIVAGVFFMIVIVAGFPLLYLINTIYDESNFTARFDHYSNDFLRQRASTHRMLHQFMLPGEWISLDRHNAFTRKFWHCIHEYKQRRPYWMAMELIEAALIGMAYSITNDTPFVCQAELCVILVLRFCMLIALIVLRPYNTNVGMLIAVLFNTFQVFLVAVKIADIFKGETRLIEGMLYFVNIVVSLVFIIVNGINIGVLAVIYWQQRKRNKNIRRGTDNVSHAEPLLNDDAFEVDGIAVGEESQFGDDVASLRSAKTGVSTSTKADRARSNLKVDGSGNVYDKTGKPVAMGQPMVNVRGLLSRMGMVSDDGTKVRRESIMPGEEEVLEMAALPSAIVDASNPLDAKSYMTEDHSKALERKSSASSMAREDVLSNSMESDTSLKDLRGDDEEKGLHVKCDIDIAEVEAAAAVEKGGQKKQADAVNVDLDADDPFAEDSDDEIERLRTENKAKRRALRGEDAESSEDDDNLLGVALNLVTKAKTKKKQAAGEEVQKQKQLSEHQQKFNREMDELGVLVVNPRIRTMAAAPPVPEDRDFWKVLAREVAGSADYKGVDYDKTQDTAFL